jgi:hypothetical protein
MAAAAAGHDVWAELVAKVSVKDLAAQYQFLQADVHAITKEAQALIEINPGLVGVYSRQLAEFGTLKNDGLYNLPKDPGASRYSNSLRLPRAIAGAVDDSDVASAALYQKLVNMYSTLGRAMEDSHDPEFPNPIQQAVFEVYQGHYPDPFDMYGKRLTTGFHNVVTVEWSSEAKAFLLTPTAHHGGAAALMPYTEEEEEEESADFDFRAAVEAPSPVHFDPREIQDASLGAAGPAPPPTTRGVKGPP